MRQPDVAKSDEKNYGNRLKLEDRKQLAKSTYPNINFHLWAQRHGCLAV